MLISYGEPTVNEGNKVELIFKTAQKLQIRRNGVVETVELKDGKLVCTEVYRFEHGIKDENGVLVWDLDVLFEHILTGFEVCEEKGYFPICIIA